jgi:hypothetical protein
MTKGYFSIMYTGISLEFQHNKAATKIVEDIVQISLSH